MKKFFWLALSALMVCAVISGVNTKVGAIYLYDDYAVILQSSYDSEAKAASVTLGFVDGTQGEYTVKKSAVVMGNSVGDEYYSAFANNGYFGMVVKYEMSTQKSVDLSAQNLEDIIADGNRTVRYSSYADDTYVKRATFFAWDWYAFYPLDLKVPLFVIYGNPCHYIDDGSLKSDTASEGYAPIQFRAYRLADIVNLQAGKIDSLYVGNKKCEAPVACYALNTDSLNKYVIAASLTVGSNLNGVELRDVIYGDINSDGTVNGKDLTRLGKYFAGWDVEINTAASDVNGDGTVNGKDLTRLGKYFAGWDVTLGE